MISSTQFPLVTVVTPSLNQGRFIEETILSVLSQDYPNIEYIVVDGGSNDGTIEILRKYEDRLRWISEQDNGQSHAINKGFRIARGEIISWINSDDIYEPGAVRTAVDYLVSNDHVAMIYGRVNVIDEVGLLTDLRREPGEIDLWSLVHCAKGIDQASTFFRKSVLEKIGYLDEKLHWSMDWDLWVRIGSHFIIKDIDFVFAKIRLYSGNKTASGGVKRFIEGVRLLRRYSNCSRIFGAIRIGFGSFHMHLRFNHPIIYKYLKPKIYSFKNALLDKYYSNYRGVFPDNWLGKKARFMLPMGMASSFIRFVINMPDDQHLLPNHVVAKLNKATVGKMTMLKSGNYELHVPYDAHAERPTEVELIFSKALPPDSQRRRLVCKLVEVTFAP